ncbi:alpha-1,4-glucan--maltose-1-phosphate maltosyltransferase [Bifidobacterium aquikefiri]|uniref:alpha-1,4-glucan--maltose-1-phosphate maltosyltransferase n=2 Tax=Bifidobacterium aquikefiri TaxID=1653207 RepID=UPI0039ECFD22
MASHTASHASAGTKNSARSDAQSSPALKSPTPSPSITTAATPAVTSKPAATSKPIVRSKREAATPAHSKKTGRSAPSRTKAQPTLASHLFGRIVVMNTTPTIEDDDFPARVELGEMFQISAQIFIEGRTKVGATAVLRNPHGKVMAQTPMVCTNAGLDTWEVSLKAGEHSDVKPWEPSFSAIRRHLGLWTVAIEGWEDSYASWLHDATIKISVNDDIENTLQEGGKLLRRWSLQEEKGLLAKDRRTLAHAAQSMLDVNADISQRFAAAQGTAIARLHAEHPLRDHLCASREKEILVQRPASSFAAWYQFFTRSEGASVDPRTQEIISGTFATSVSGLERAKAEGFDIVYLPPIFPIGTTNRKGRNNALVAGPDDPGSPFGIGSRQGGHDTVNPQLGTMDDFKAFVSKAHELGIEIALDFALQCSPDHPWVHSHPEWFRHKPDGSIAFAENPPKKYQDIYPIDFDEDMPGIEREVERIMRLWIDAGVTIFRVDNPHTKPVRFWQDIIAKITKRHPEILFLAEAFTRPGMMRALSYVGFTQSHCYFPWRNGKEELQDYLQETNGDAAFYQHNTFWPTTPDILTDYIRDNGIAGHAIRAVLAATGSPSWGIYNGYELIENRQRPGFEEQLDNEKYEIKIRDWSRAQRYGIAELLTRLNQIRHAHPALMSYHDLRILESSDPNVLAFVRHIDGSLTPNGMPDTVIVVVNLDGHDAHSSGIYSDPTTFGIEPGHVFDVHDELTGREFVWSGSDYVSLAPWADVAHILTVRHPHRD